MDNREMIEKALGPYLLRHRFLKPGTNIAMIDIKSLDLDALAEQAIVIECEVEHSADFSDEVNSTLIRDSTRHRRLIYAMDGIRGIPGKAIAIIVSLERHGNTEQS